MRTNHSSRILVAAALLVAGAVGCGDDKPAAKGGSGGPAAAAPAADPAAGGEAVAEAGGEAKPKTPDYVYSPVGKRDPFRSFYQDNEIAEEKAPEANSRCGPICRWELDQLKLVAVVSGTASPMAMVEDPDGKGHVLRRGSFIGKRSGKVSDIRRDEIVITELLRRPSDGALIPTKTEMTLRNKASGQGDGQASVDLTAPEE